MIRISHVHSTRILYAETVDQIVRAVRALEPGLYRLDLITMDARQSESSPRSWGIAAKQTDGLIVLTINP